MSDGASQYPIQKFLQLLIEQYGPTPTEFVQSLGYSTHVDRALHRIGLWLSDGQGYDKIIRQIAWKYPDHADELRRAIAATTAMQHAEAEAAFLERCRAEVETFVPFIHAMGEVNVPNGICIFGMTGGFKRWTRIDISQSILELPVEEQLASLTDLMLGYVRKYNGRCPFFGKLTEFRFCRCLDYFRFDSGGNFIEHVATPFRHGDVGIALR